MPAPRPWQRARPHGRAAIRPPVEKTSPPKSAKMTVNASQSVRSQPEQFLPEQRRLEPCPSGRVTQGKSKGRGEAQDDSPRSSRRHRGQYRPHEKRPRGMHPLTHRSAPGAGGRGGPALARPPRSPRIRGARTRVPAARAAGGQRELQSEQHGDGQGSRPSGRPGSPTLAATAGPATRAASQRRDRFRAAARGRGHQERRRTRRGASRIGAPLPWRNARATIGAK
jgi:hypothetical protein